jgi:EpsI family protein
MRQWAFAAAAGMLAVTSVLIGSSSQSEAVPPRQPLAGFPLEIGDGFKGRDLDMDPKVLEVLRLTDYLMRVYAPPARGGDAGAARLPIWLYVGYYESQRTGSTYHSPKNCLPGAGWQIGESTTATLSLPTLGEATINRVLIEKGLDKQLVVYWYQDRGRVIASEYEAKVMLIWDSITRHRSDGALVRFTTPVVAGVEEAWTRTLAFVREAWPLLLPHLPA